MQIDLFAPTGEIVKSPICCRMKHCGALAILGEPEDLGGCVNQSILCQRCGDEGVLSWSVEVKPEAVNSARAAARVIQGALSPLRRVKDTTVSTPVPSRRTASSGDARIVTLRRKDASAPNATDSEQAKRKPEGDARGQTRVFSMIRYRRERQGCSVRLSEAIRLGSMLHPQAYGVMQQMDGERVIGTCALGAAHEAGFDILSIDNRLASEIQHLNDWDRWTRERIADFVESCERSEEPVSQRCGTTAMEQPVLATRG